MGESTSKKIGVAELRRKRKKKKGMGGKLPRERNEKGVGGGGGDAKTKNQKKEKERKAMGESPRSFFFKKKGTKEEKEKAKKWARVLRKRGEGAELRRIGRKGKQLE